MFCFLLLIVNTDSVDAHEEFQLVKRQEKRSVHWIFRSIETNIYHGNIIYNSFGTEQCRFLECVFRFLPDIFIKAFFIMLAVKPIKENGFETKFPFSVETFCKHRNFPYALISELVKIQMWSNVETLHNYLATPRLWKRAFKSSGAMFVICKTRNYRCFHSLSTDSGITSPLFSIRSLAGLLTDALC